MLTLVKKNRFASILIFVLYFAFVIISPYRITGQVKTTDQAAQTLAEISDEEKAVLEDLFTLSQEIDEINKQEAEIGKEMEQLRKKITGLEETIKEHQKDYDSQLEILEQVLVSYQKRGSASYLEILLSSENLTDFIRNMNGIRDLSHNTADLLDSLQEEKIKLASEQENLKQNMSLLKNKSDELQKALVQKTQLKQEQEAYLESLKEKKEYYQGQLGDLEQSWNDIKTMFSDISEEFPHIMQEGNLTVQDLNLSFDFSAVKGTIYEEKINEIIGNNAKLPGMVFDLTPGMVRVEIPENHLTLNGPFSIDNGNALKYEVKEGSFYGLPLEPASIKELFRNGYLLIDLKDVAGGMTLKSVEVLDGCIEFQVNIF